MCLPVAMGRGCGVSRVLVSMPETGVSLIPGPPPRVLGGCARKDDRLDKDPETPRPYKPGVDANTLSEECPPASDDNPRDFMGWEAVWLISWIIFPVETARGSAARDLCGDLPESRRNSRPMFLCGFFLCFSQRCTVPPQRCGKTHST